MMRTIYHLMEILANKESNHSNVDGQGIWWSEKRGETNHTEASMEWFLIVWRWYLPSNDSGASCISIHWDIIIGLSIIE
jgi:uncharacterized membrane protein YfbV (UPF0208 family)